MEKAIDSQQKATSVGEDNASDEIQELLLTLPSVINFGGSHIYQYKGCWYHDYHPKFLKGMISSQRHFQAQDSDVILITFPKSGTTWLKALTYAIVHHIVLVMQYLIQLIALYSPQILMT
ncbi:hypothetical protein LWI28_016815 [Acer negundo]|uniref:Sulfotransferase n=1 Tax=Acer negundo TaxID=4023 RepID=A0AAD5I9T0_ACENE|nr:hypothetical protein LWI28_016815 [Acer negundo]